MQSFGWNKIYPILLSAIVISAVLGMYYQSIETTAQAILGLCGLVLLLLVLFFNAFFFYLGLVAFIPISLDAAIFGDAVVTLPSEGMLLMLLPVVLLFQRDYTRAIRTISVHPIAILLAADLIVQTITTLTSTHLDVSVKRLLIRVLFVSGFFVTINALNGRKQIVRIWMAYAIGLVPVMYFTFRNFAHFDFDPKTVFVISKPYFVDHTLYGACLAFVLPLLAVFLIHRKKLEWKSWQITSLFVLTLLVFGSELMALSRAALLSLVVALLFALLLYLKVRFRTIILGLLVLVGTAIALKNPIYSYLEKNEAVSNDGEITNHLSSVTNIQSDASNLERVNRWVCAIRMFEEKPLVGFGPGTYQFEYNKFQTMEHKTYISTNAGDKGNAHSEYLTYLSENGLLGALIFVLTVFAAVYFGMQNHVQLKDPVLRMLNLGILLGLITYFFHGVFNAFMDQSKMAFLYFTALGTIVWLNLNLKNGTTEHD